MKCLQCGADMKKTDTTVGDDGEVYDYYDCTACMWDENVKVSLFMLDEEVKSLIKILQNKINARE